MLGCRHVWREYVSILSFVDNLEIRERSWLKALGLRHSRSLLLMAIGRHCVWLPSRKFWGLLWQLGFIIEMAAPCTVRRASMQVSLTPQMFVSCAGSLHGR